MQKLSLYAPLGIIIALSLKATILGINISDSLVAISLVGLLCLREHLDKHKKMQDIETLVNTKLEQMKNAINSQNTVIEAQAQEYDKLRNSMTGIKLAFGQKDSSVSGRKIS